MRGLARFYPPDREVLKGINLSFYPGAKIGVIGSNGSGKSSLLQIMAGGRGGVCGGGRPRLRLPPGEADVTKLSGGERRRVALCRLLLQKPDLLLLDEPTNHLDAESVAWLQRFLADYPGTVVTVTHDRYFLDEVAGWILEVDRGRGIPYEGNYSGWLEQKQKRLEQEGRLEAARRRTLERELEWVRQSPRARQAKSKG